MTTDKMGNVKEGLALDGRDWDWGLWTKGALDLTGMVQFLFIMRIHSS